ncbi:MAG: S8 family serine peptidase [Oscillospiraceae bacterium]|nr:S8 family serine peptidase [Oscillospiraceae bacterium]
MKRNALTRLLCMILALCTVLSMMPMAFATEIDEPEVPAETIVETEPVETEPVETEPAETEPVETPSEATLPEETIPEEPVPEETVPEESVPEETIPEESVPEETIPEESVPEETVPEESVPEETVPEESVPEDADAVLPYGLKGLPEDYVFTEQALADKAFMIEYDVVGTLSKLTPGVDYVDGEILVDAASLEEAELFAAAFNGHLKEYTTKLAVITLDAVDVVTAVTAAADIDVRLPAASPNYIVTLDPLEDSDMIEGEAEDMLVSTEALPERKSWNTWVLDTMTNPDPYLVDPTGQDNYYQYMHDVVDTYAAWGVTTGNPSVKVAVIDTGVNGNHVELSGRVSYVRVNSSLGNTDDNGHGTHVAGIIAAAMDNGYGGAGIAPGVSIMSLKVLDARGSGTEANIINAIYKAVDNGAWIINMSLGGYWASSSYQNAINYAYNNGVTVIVAMGNDSSNIKCYPAALKNVVSVVSTDQTNSRSYFSNWGSWGDVAAPGSYIWAPYHGNNYGMTRKSGTSMATPVVAGVAALYMSANGWVSPSKMESVLKSSCVKGGSNLGKGIVNAANMFSKSKPAVDYAVFDNYGYEYTGKTVPCDAYVNLWGTPILDDTGIIVYTTNGKTPSIKNGQIVNGQEFNGAINLVPFAGKSVTIKAIAVNGLGIAGSVKTIKLKVSTSSSVSSVSVEGPDMLVSGKSATYKATVLPEKANQSVTWSIVNRSGMTSAKISSSGKLTTSSKQEGWVVIRATSMANTNRYKDFTVYTQKIKPVSSMALNLKSATLTLGTGYAADTKVSLYISKMVDSSKNPIDPNVSGVKWSSSKTSVATVDQNGNVKAVAAGTATITCKAQDGSGKSATCKITVKQRVTGITVSGYPTMAPGGSATYKATCNPTNASSKSVTWSLSGAPSGAKITSKGKVTLPKSASAYIGGSFLVIATAKDGSGVVGYQWVTIQPKCTGLYMNYSGQDPLLVKTNSSGYVTSAVLYTFEDTYYSGNDEDIQLSVIGKNLTPAVKWSSSAPSVAQVSENGYVVAKKAGTAKITATAQDGSGKKATVTITVRNPVSSMSVKSGMTRSQGDVGYLAFGKSVTNSAVFADTYGTVSNKAVTWSYKVYGVNSYGSFTNDYTDYFRSQKWVSISTSGKLTTSSKIKNYWLNISGDLMVRVVATSKDNPSVCGTFDYYLVRPATTLRASQTSGWMYRNSEGAVNIYCDVWRPYWNDGYELTATSSNPSVVGAVYILPHEEGSNWFQLYFASGSKKGTATITVKATDGSGKSCKIKIQVR